MESLREAIKHMGNRRASAASTASITKVVFSEVFGTERGNMARLIHRKREKNEFDRVPIVGRRWFRDKDVLPRSEKMSRRTDRCESGLRRFKLLNALMLRGGCVANFTVYDVCSLHFAKARVQDAGVVEGVHNIIVLCLWNEYCSSSEDT